eukprot:499368-Amphidinium_carterae.1
MRICPLAELPQPLAAQVLNPPVPKGSVARQVLRSTPPPIPDLTREQTVLFEECFRGVSDAPVGNAHSHNFHMVAYLMTDVESGENIWATPHPAIMGCVLTR